MRSISAETVASTAGRGRLLPTSMAYTHNNKQAQRCEPLRLSLSKTRESSSRPQPSRASIESGGVYAGFAAISSEGSLPPGEEIASLQFPRPEMRSISAETGRGGSLPGEFAPPPPACLTSCAHGLPAVRALFFCCFCLFLYAAGLLDFGYHGHAPVVAGAV